MQTALRKHLFSLIAIFTGMFGFHPAVVLAQTVKVFTASTTFTVPACVSSITVQCWGAGGGGGGATTADGGAAGAGGGGGGFATATLNNVSGSFTVTVGLGGQGGNGNGTSGGNGGSSSVSNGTLTVTAAGGGGGGGCSGGVSSAVGVGGSGSFAGGAAGNTYAGGNGGQGNNADDNTGGAGGGGAGNAGDGGTAGNTGEDANSIGGTGGAGVSGPGYSGSGGAGGSVSAAYYENGDNGSPIGGGGGGGGGETSGGLFGHGTSPGTGGNGSNGQVVITYNTSTPTITGLGDGTGCVGGTITITGTLLSGATSVTIGSTAITNLNATATTITGTIAAGTTTGIVTVNTPCGNVSSTGVFVVYSSPVVNLGTFSVCGGTGYTFGGQTYTTAGTYSDTATSVNGCDSITTVTLTGAPTVYKSISQSICQGSSYLFGTSSYNISGIYYDTTASVVTGCDSITTLALEVTPYVTEAISQLICPGSNYMFGGISYNTSGVYMDTTTSSVTGCDSITTLTLSVSAYLYHSVSQTICQGDTFNFNGNNYTATGTYNDTIQGGGSGGCDSISSLTLTVNPVAEVNVSVTGNKNEICSSDSAQLCASQGFASYAWNNGDSTACFYTSIPGKYSVTVSEVSGCTAISSPVNISVYTTMDVGINTHDDTIVCIDSAVSYQWYFGTQLLSGDTSNLLIAIQSGNYTVVLEDTNGCYYISPIAQISTAIGNVAATGKISVFPNPLSSGNWQLDVTQDLLGSWLEIFDASGQSVYKSQIRNQHSAILTDLARGIYLMQIRSAETTFAFKLVKLN